MFGTLVAFAEGEANTQMAAQGGAGSVFGLFLPMIIVMVIMYFLMIRPQRKREKEVQNMQSALRVGDKVVTIGGIVGKVAKIKDEFVYIETSMPGAPEKAYIKMERGAIKEVTKKAEDKKKTVAPVEPVEEETDETNLD